MGRSISRRGLAKKTGGIGKKITGITHRRFFPNLQKVKVRFPNGTVRRITESSVIFDERLTDPLGRPRTREVVKQLSPN